MSVKIISRKGNESMTISMLYVFGIIIGFVLIYTIFTFWRGDFQIANDIITRIDSYTDAFNWGSN